MANQEPEVNSKAPKFDRNYTGIVAAVSLALGFYTTEFVPAGTFQKALMYFGPIISAVLGYVVYFLLELLPIPRVEDVRKITAGIKLWFYVAIQKRTLSDELAAKLEQKYQESKFQSISERIDNHQKQKVINTNSLE